MFGKQSAKVVLSQPKILAIIPFVLNVAIALQTGELNAQEASLLPGDFSAQVGFFTDYAFRGISQTMEDPAFQGNIEYTQYLAPDRYFYAGFWGSNVDFGGDEDVEIDFYGGFGGETKLLRYDLGATYYSYPGSDADLGYVEVQGLVGLDFGRVSWQGGLKYSPDYFAESGDAFYLFTDLDLPLALAPHVNITLTGHVGYQTIQRPDRFGADDYVNWKIAAIITLYGLDFDLRYHDTDIEGGTALDADARFIFGVSRRF